MTAAERDLLFGLLALNNGMIGRPQLVDAFRAWDVDRSRSLAEHLTLRGDLDADDRAAVEALAGRHVRRHGDDAERSLTSLPVGRSTLEFLESLAVPELTATLIRLDGSTEPGDAPDRTATTAVGQSPAGAQRFRVLRPHARGGLGAVFIAIDAELNREVALKRILDGHADNPTNRRRFLVEAEITGGLEHPGIVPVYGLGTYEDGRPYYAMRFIRGESLKEAIASFHGSSPDADAGRRSLGLRKLLRRFTDVCNAVEYAHSRGVLHRDIKPSNVIVGKHGETLLVDWGLARARGRGEEVPANDEATLVTSSAGVTAETVPGQTLGTPAYMSPEQAYGDLGALGPRSDVYSLGATLFTLLTGRAAFEGDVLGYLLEAVRRGDFPPPRRLDSAIDRPLEAICLKAMATDPAGRYPSARALADDVERWLADEPVAAWPEPWTRSLSRWLGRHRTAVTAAAAAALAALVGLGAVAAAQTRGRLELEAKNAELRSANARVEQRYELAAEAIRTFHTGVSEDFLMKEPQFQELRDRLLHSASAFYQRLGRLLDREADLDSRRTLAGANFELAELTARVGRAEDALAAHRAVLAAREALASVPGADPDATVEVGRSLTEVGRLLAATGRAEEALAAHRGAEARLSDLAGSTPSAMAALAACRSRMGELLAWTGRREEALAAYRRARSDQEGPALAPGAPAQARSDLAATLLRIANLLAETGRPGQAEAEYRAALALLRPMAESRPAVADSGSRLADGHVSLGVLLSRTGRPGHAEAEYRAALALRRALAESHPAVTEFRRLLANSHDNLGVLLAETGRPGRGRVPRLALDPATTGRPASRGHPIPLSPGEHSQQHRRAAGRDGPDGPGGARLSRGPGTLSESGRVPSGRRGLPDQAVGDLQQSRQPAR